MGASVVALHQRVQRTSSRTFIRGKLKWFMMKANSSRYVKENIKYFCLGDKFKSIISNDSRKKETISLLISYNNVSYFYQLLFADFDSNSKRASAVPSTSRRSHRNRKIGNNPRPHPVLHHK